MRNTSLLLLLVSTLFSCRTYYNPADVDIAYQRVAESQVPPDEEVDDMITPYREKLVKEMNEVIGTLDKPLRKERPESDIGNWMADMMQEEVNRALEGSVDFSVQNYGGIRVGSMAEGPITVGEIFEMMPFDNMISILTTDGQGVKRFLDHVAEGKGWPVSKGLSFVIDEDVAIDIVINGEPLDLDKTYRFAVPDYVANGGSGSGFLREYRRQDMNVLIRDAFLTHIRRDTEAGMSQSPVKEGRVKTTANE